MPRPTFRTLIIRCALTAVVLPASVVHAQSWKDRVKSAAQRGATEAAARRAEDAARKGTDKSIDAAVGGAMGAAGIADPKAKDARPTAATTSTAATAGASAAAPANAANAFANYDFVPGTRPLYVDDFTLDAVGDFPKRLKWENGNYEVVEHEGSRWMRATTFGWFSIPLPEMLPERFTLEMNVIAPSGWVQEVYFGAKSRGTAQSHVVLAPDRGGVKVDGMPTMSQPAQRYDGRPIPLRVMADGQHVKVFMGETRVANIPQVDLGRDRAIRVGVSASASSPVLIGNVRVMAGGKALYDALSESGRVATQGILFATNSDALLDESTPTLKEIAAMLASHDALSLTIEGHTDNVGAAAANQALSERRAAAVKAALVGRFDVNADRLATQGFGAAKPAAPNVTAEGRAANRRVELVKR